MNARILVEISTKNRDVCLGRCFASLLNQSFEDWDLLIINDGKEKIGRTKTTEYMLGIIRENDHEVWIVPGTHVSQAHNHNISLYDKRFRNYELIFRADDDIYLDTFALENLEAALRTLNLGAVGGLWFESEFANEEFFDRGLMGWEPGSREETDGKVGNINSNWQQRLYRPTTAVQEVQHIYSNCLYRASAMRAVGGWPEVYSRGVAHGEETDGTYRMFLAGYKLGICPTATGRHEKAPGGIRLAENVGEKQYLDRVKWANRRPCLEDINFSPTVAVWCQHSFGHGGAQRQFYQTVSLLQKSGLAVYPIFTGLYLSPEECQEAFGFSYQECEYQEYGPPDKYDVCIVMGHQPHKPVEAKHYILYTFFPDETDLKFGEFDLILGNSKYTAHWVGERWGYRGYHLYPPVTPIGNPDNVAKEKIVLIVARGDPHKAPLWLMERFVEFDFQDWECHLVMATTGGVFTSYEEQIRTFAEHHKGVFVHENVSNEDLCNMYRRASILWHAKGLYAEANPKEAEHFGLVPVEAWSARCVPIVYDLGGHQETVHEDLRWKTPEELKEITLRAMTYIDWDLSKADVPWEDEFPERAEWARSCTMLASIEPGQDFDAIVPVAISPVGVNKYNEADYVWQFEQWIRRVNGMAVELEKVDRLEVKSRKIEVALISDSPLIPGFEKYIGITTGFGVVMGQIAHYLLKEKDIHLSIFGMLDGTIPKSSWNLPFDYFPAVGDPEGVGGKIIPAFVSWAQPDVALLLYDPGSMLGHCRGLHHLGVDIPLIGYFPIEGHSRIGGGIPELLGRLTHPVTYCHSGADLIRRFVPDAEILVAGHGADHALFAPLLPERRTKLRELVGWGDKFILMNCGTNKRVKMQPILIETMRILLERGYDDVYVYLHTKPFDNHVMQGWALEHIAQREEELSGLPVTKHVLFPMAHSKLHGPMYDTDKIEDWRLSVPPMPKQRGALFNALDFITRYCLADLYVDVSAAEGWGLVPLEAAACGVPVITVDDGMARSEVHSKYCHMLKPAFTHDAWHIGSCLSHVDPEGVADMIIMLKEDDDLRLGFAGPQSRILDDLPWEKTARIFIDLIRQTVGT